MLIRRFLIVFLIQSFQLCMSSSATTKFNRCGTELELLWRRDFGPAPFAASALIADVDSDGLLDVVAAHFSGQVHMVLGRDGQLVTGAQWPVIIQHSSIHASPLQLDVDGDGVLDILICTSQAQLIALSATGKPIKGKRYQLPDVYIERSWHEKVVTADRDEIHSFIVDGQPSQQEMERYVHIPAHILASPALGDLNEDGLLEELVIPVSYYLDEQQHSLLVDKAGLPALSELDNYLVSALVIFNLTSMQPIRTIHLDLTKMHSDYPAYVLSSPTIVQLDSGLLDIVVGTSAGHLHRLDTSGQSHPGFPIARDSIVDKVAIDDINKDGLLEIVVVDRSGNIACYSPDGAIIWETQLWDKPTSGVKFADLNGDGHLDVVVGSVDGQVWAFHGVNGTVIGGWPIKVAKSLAAPVTVARLAHSPLPTVMVLADDKHLHLVTSGDNACLHVIGIDELSFVAILSHDLDPTSPGLELLIATRGGSLLCFRHAASSGKSPTVVTQLHAWPTENVDTFYNGMKGVQIDRPIPGGVAYYGESEFSVNFRIYDNTEHPANCNISVELGARLLGRVQCGKVGAHSVLVYSPRRPYIGQLCVRLTNQHAQVFTSCMSVSFHMRMPADLQWLLATPAILLALLLLFLHGFPKTDLLPVTIASKER